MPLPNQTKTELKHLRELDKYTQEIRRAYLDVISQVAKLSKSVKLNAQNQFYFKSNTKLNRQVNKLLKQLYSKVYSTTVLGIQTEWDRSTEKLNELAYYAFGKEALEAVPASVRNKILSGNSGARLEFLRRKEQGLKLSERIWNNTKQFKQELELALEYGIGKGKSARSLATEIKQYLNEPDRLYRRVRDEQGILRLSKAAAIYKPGRGISRSSYKNAVRLARNEINFSYEQAKKVKREQQDFIVGIEIKVSPSHNPLDDKGGISCLSLQGKYPKTFDFTYKWHVNCKCQSFEVLKTREELLSDVDKILAGENPNTPSKRQVNNTPTNYNNYVKENQKKWADLKNPPRTFEKNK